MNSTPQPILDAIARVLQADPQFADAKDCVDCCVMASKSLIAELAAAGMKGELVGSYEHAWVLVDGFNIDLTARQFDENEPCPVLRLLETMSDEEFKEFERLTMLHNVTKAEMAEDILSKATPETVVYAMSKHFDLYKLIENKKAIQREKSYRFKKIESKTEVAA